jgi:tripartite-type tricarboxylate transporter receptor subunit TctC
MTKRILLFAVAVLACASNGTASAQTYPAKPIRIIVAFAPGGPADVMARLVGQKLTATLGQNIVIDNRPGAGGTIGARAAAEAEPDGYSLLLGNTSTLIIGPLIYKNVNYDAVKSFAPVALLGTTSNLLIVNPALPARSVQELVALARAQPGRLNFSSAGIGTPPHLIGEMFKQRLGLEVVHVPYKGGGPSVQAVVAGETQFSFENPASSLALAQAGTVRALAVTSESRNPQTPDLPTMIEAGVPDFTSVSHARLHCQPAQHRHQRKREIARGRRRAGEAQRRGQARDAGGVRGLRRQGAGEVGDGGEDGRRAGGMIIGDRLRGASGGHSAGAS